MSLKLKMSNKTQRTAQLKNFLPLFFVFPPSIIFCLKAEVKPYLIAHYGFLCELFVTEAKIRLLLNILTEFSQYTLKYT